MKIIARVAMVAVLVSCSIGCEFPASTLESFSELVNLPNVTIIVGEGGLPAGTSGTIGGGNVSSQSCEEVFEYDPSWWGGGYEETYTTNCSQLGSSSSHH